MKIKEQAYAKINLALDVVGKRDDGYHALQMIMIPIELHDTLMFEDAKKTSISSNITIENNAILKAIHLMKERFRIQKEVHVTLDKHIPMGAGLGGGSADIAATLRGLNRLWNLDLSLDELAEIALELGSDTKFCIYNEPAYVHGRGEHLIFIDPIEINQIFLFPSTVEASTKRIFQNHTVAYKRRKFQKLMTLYLNRKTHKFYKKTYNTFLKTTLKTYPELKEKYKKIKRVLPLVQMTGSGSTFYALIFNENIKAIEEKLDKLDIDIIKTKPKN